jgi:radical SAM superfamily enzyme YgiQ (UPF0313 family)
MKINLISTDSSVYCNGVRSISSYVKQKGHETRIIFLPQKFSSNKLYSDKVLKNIKSLIDGDLIGISCDSFNSIGATQIIDFLKDDTDAPIVWGGIHATLNSERSLKHSDYVCVGEGEESIVDLIEAIDCGKSTTNIKNIMSKTKNNQVRCPIDLNTLPFPDYDPMDHWMLKDNKIVSFDNRYLKEDLFNLFVLDYFKRGMDVKNILLYHDERGCHNSCSFCCNSSINVLYKNYSKHIVRRRNIVKMISELDYIIGKVSGAEAIMFTDDSFFNRDVADLELFSLIYKKNINLPFACYADPKHINDEKLDILFDAGLKKVTLGIQGSDNINRTIYNRNINKDVVFSSSLKLNKRKICTEHQIIISSPYDANDDMIEVISLLKRLPKPFILQASSLIFFPGSILYNKAISEGLISESDYTLGYTETALILKKRDRFISSLYLNYLLRIMNGRTTSYKYGIVPIFLLDFLIKLNINNSIMFLIINLLSYFAYVLSDARMREYFIKLKENFKYVGIGNMRQMRR